MIRVMKFATQPLELDPLSAGHVRVLAILTGTALMYNDLSLVNVKRLYLRYIADQYSEMVFLAERDAGCLR